MHKFSEEEEQFILDLMKIDGIKFGKFKLKSGIDSPVYFDLRVIVSYPELLTKASELVSKKSKLDDLTYDHICGVPYTALPIATCVSTSNNVRMLIKRKEKKAYGTGKILEGHFKQGETCLIIEDVVTSGSSVLDTYETLKNEGLKVTDAIVLLNRQQGGQEALLAKGISLHSLFNLSDIADYLSKCGEISEDMCNQVKMFIKNNFVPYTGDDIPNEGKLINSKSNNGTTTCYKNKFSRPKTYGERARLCKNQVSKRLLNIMEEKETNLCLSADVTSSVELLEMAEKLGPLICILKTHIDILEDFKAPVLAKLVEIANTHNFLLFEDRKFCDIGNTVKSQYRGGLYQICKWADIVNAHSVSGEGVVQGLRECVNTRTDRCCLLIAEMSPKGNLANGDYTKATVAMADKHKDFIVGFISTSCVSDDPTYIHMTPGIKLMKDCDQLGQQYLTPETIIRDRGCDVIIVGRGITMAANRLKEATNYCTAGWRAYKERLIMQ